MREHKYKVWDKILQCWSKNTHKWISCGDGIITPDSGNRYVFVESTGLYDSTRTGEYPEGREVYEGDIVRAIYNSTPQECHLGIIAWDEETLSYVIETVAIEGSESVTEGRKLWFEPTVKKTCQVIGDIHTTPDLLEEEK